MEKRGGSWPNCIIVNPKTKRFVLLKVNGQPLDLPSNWKIWPDTLCDLERKAFRQVVSKSEAEQLLPDEIVQLRV